MPLIDGNDIFERFRYPVGETHVRMKGPLPKSDETILWPAHNWNDVMDIYVARNILTSMKLYNKFLIPYLPFGRHDRPMCLGDGQPLELICRALDNWVIQVDAHSEASHQIKEITQKHMVDCYRKIMQDRYDVDPIFIVPDKGAVRKARSWLNWDHGDCINKYDPTIYCDKERDPKTGNITGFSVTGDREGIVGVAPLLIVDDICDGGGTFVGLAKMLREKYNPTSITLGVTHGFFTRGIEALHGIDHVITLDIYKDRTTSDEHEGPTTSFVSLDKLFNTWEQKQ